MKKIISMFLALVMALALAVPAFATSGTVKVDSSLQLPTLNVVLPTTASMIMNPYKMEVKVNPKDTTTVNDQIVSATMEVKNLSDIDVQVGIKVQGTIKNTADTKPAFAAGTTASSSAKEAWIYVAFEIGNTGMTVSDTNGTGGGTVVLTTAEQEVTDFASNASPASGNTLKASANKKDPATNGVLGFKFFGDISPVTSWTDKDTMAANIAFTFTPVANNTTPAGPTTYSISEGSHSDSGSDISAVSFEVGGSAATSAAENDTVTIKVTATTGKTITAAVNGGSSINLTETSGTYTGTFTMPAQAASVVITVA